MNFQMKLQVFRALVQNQSLAELKKQLGDEGIEVIQQIADACERQDSEILLDNLDRYLMLASASYRAIQVTHTEMTTEAFNNIRDAIAPVLEEIKRATPISERVEKEGKKKKKQRRVRLPGRHKQAE